MSRSRNIKPSFFCNDLLAECEPLARLLFIGLWTIADREGRLLDRPKKIKVQTLPYDNCDPNKLLNELARHGFILRYAAENNNYIQILNFQKHQNPHMKEAESNIPAPDKHQTSPVQNVPLPSSLNPLPSSLKVREKGAGKISLEELSVNHITEWLKKKRKQGRYTNHDPEFVLEKLKDYCLSKNKKYDDYVAAYRNAFDWEKCQPGKTGKPLSMEDEWELHRKNSKQVS